MRLQVPNHPEIFERICWAGRQLYLDDTPSQGEGDWVFVDTPRKFDPWNFIGLWGTSGENGPVASKAE
jgi:hypothetical protein